ncbi:6969_t:CDS:2 [Ambispora leptoticha]|uniref:6969_t:CDS:1 n=1 Tax=Ambispora leptoticha TaxID=144679 RepID=A0A9N8V7P5_9GLOM|nr:6969_t:CDS:2 [Ambispora leptoticha]
MDGGKWNEKKYNGLLGFKEFKRKLRKYIVNLEDDMTQGKKTKQTINALLGPPGVGGRSDTGIFEGVSPSTKAPFAGRLCEGLARSKQRNVIVLLDEPDKIQEGIPDFIFDRVTFIDLPIYTYKEREDYVVSTLSKLLDSDEKTKRYADQIKDNKDFCKYIITEAWGLRQVNANIDEIFKSLRYYVNMESKGYEKSIGDFTKPTKVETTKNRFNLIYKEGQEINLNRVRTFSRVEDNNEKGEKVPPPPTAFPEYNCRIVMNANNEIEIELNISDEPKYQEELIKFFRCKTYEDYSKLLSMNILFNEELEELKQIEIVKGKLTETGVSYDFDRPDLAII